MSIYEVTNHEELGNAIWLSVDGDYINITTGEYGYIPLKEGVNYTFGNSASAVKFFGLGVSIGDDNLKCSSIEIGRTVIKQPKIKSDNIKMYYVFRQKLPFNSQLPNPSTFLHPNGTLVTIYNEATQQGFRFGDEDGLPCDYIDIAVPSFSFYDLEPVNDNSQGQLEISSTESELKNFGYKNNKLEFSPFRNIFEYHAFWAVNDFIREYTKLFNLNHIEGYSTNRFFYGLKCAIFYKLNEPPVSNCKLSSIGRFSISNEPTNVPVLQKSLLNTEDFSLHQYIEINLNKLCYQAAIIGMYQLFEIEWKSSGGEKFDYVDRNASNLSVKKNIAEMINARNWIVHHRTLKTENSRENKLKTDDWGAEKLNQFQIFYRQKPWEWYSFLLMFLRK